MSHVLAIDQGTTGSTVIILDFDGEVKAKVNEEYRQIYPQPGWVEHDPEDIWASVLNVISKALKAANISGQDVKAIGITNQRETTLLWNRATGQTFYNAIVWQDRRTSTFCEKLKKAGHEKKFKLKTGLVLDPYFSGTKINWLLQNVPEIKKNIKECAFGTVDSFLLWRLTGGSVHATDVSNASRTLLMDLKTLNGIQVSVRFWVFPKKFFPKSNPA